MLQQPVLVFTSLTEPDLNLGGYYPWVVRIWCFWDAMQLKYETRWVSTL